MGPRYGRLGACDGGGVKPGIVGGAPGTVVCGGVTLFDATRVGPCPTPKAKPNTRIITRPAAQLGLIDAYANLRASAGGAG